MAFRRRLDAGFGVDVFLGAIAFGAVAAEQSKDDGRASAGEENETPADDSTGDVGDQKDDDACVHEDSEQDSEVTFRHGVASSGGVDTSGEGNLLL